jgi:putative transcriptional regulator
MKTSEHDTEFGLGMIESLKEVLAHRKGEISLPSRIVHAMPPEQVRRIRKSVAKSPKDFERRFGIPARTIEGWEQGKKLDTAHRVLLTLIANAPEMVEANVALPLP